MARRAKLKVYRTPTGFHDAYVAAPSQKAALEAWGSDHDLFARGVAEPVTDRELMKEPLAHPGEIVKRLRGTAAEQIAALPKEKPAKRTAGEAARRSASNRTQSEPRPNRTLLDEAERAQADAGARHNAEEKELAIKEAELARQRRAMKKAHAVEAARLERERDQAQRAYERAVKRWRG